MPQAAIKTSQDNGYARRSLWHQIKMMVTVYLKQSFVQNISQQKKSKIHEITITRSEKKKKVVVKELRTVNKEAITLHCEAHLLVEINLEKLEQILFTQHKEIILFSDIANFFF